jgi:hypothetical protein
MTDRAARKYPSKYQQWWLTSDVAGYLGLRLGTISSYRSRGQMPPPDDELGGRRVWLPATITRWRDGTTLEDLLETTDRPTALYLVQCSQCEPLSFHSPAEMAQWVVSHVAGTGHSITVMPPRESGGGT